MPLAAIAGIGAIGSIASGIIGSNAAGHAADTQAAAANNAAQLERQSATDALNFNKQQYGNSLNLLSPFYNTGVAANGRLGFLMGLNPGQGLPPGVINPNAPPAARQPLDGGQLDPNALDQLRQLRANVGNTPGGNRLTPFSANSAMLQPGQNPTGAPNVTPGTTSGQPAAPGTMTNPDVGRFAPGGTQGAAQGGNAGMLQTGPDGQPTGVTPDVNPAPNGIPLSYNPQSATNGTTNQGGTGQVPQTGGNSFTGNVGPPPNLTGEAMFNPNDPNQGANPTSGSFGSLAQGWNQTFQSPNSVTEQNDPGYQFRLNQGMQALQNSAAARGGLLSGGTAKALTDYNQNAASGEYGNVYNRAKQTYDTNYNTFTNDQTNLFNRLMALQSGGQVSANNLSNDGLNFANNAGGILMNSAAQIGQQYNNAGAANASGYINQANAINGAIGGAGNSLSTLAMLRMLQNGGAGSGGSTGGWGAF